MGSLELSLGDGHLGLPEKPRRKEGRHRVAGASPAFSEQSQEDREEGLCRGCPNAIHFPKADQAEMEDNLSEGPGVKQ